MIHIYSVKHGNKDLAQLGSSIPNVSPCPHTPLSSDPNLPAPTRTNLRHCTTLHYHYYYYYSQDHQTSPSVITSIGAADDTTS